MDSKTLEAIIVAAGGVVVFNIVKVIYEFIRMKKDK